MYWNHRVYNLKDQNLGEDYFVVREAYYNDKDEIIGCTDLSVGSETLEGLRWIAEHIVKATEKPVIVDDSVSLDLFSITKDVASHLLNNNPKGDISDLGNEIGIVLGKYISDKIGYELESFISGIKHGVSLTKGTH